MKLSSEDKKACFFSIVMPVYGVEKHLSKAIDSILDQTFSDYELILVDDCSPDNCGKICDAYVEKDVRISVVHLQKNGGLSNARNKGFEQTKGKYVWFPDSDDYYEPYLLENVYQSLQKNPAELTVFGLVEDYYDNNGKLQYTKQVTMPETFISDKNLVRKKIIELEANTLYGYAWNKFYRADLIRKQNFCFEKVTLIEDIVFNVKYCMDIESLNILDVAPYHYGKRMELSLTSKFVPDYFKLHRYRVQMILDQYKSWGMCTDDVKEILSGIYIRYIMSALERNCHKESNMNVRKQYLWLSKLFESNLFKELVPHFRPNNKMTKVAGICIVGKHKMLTLGLGWIIYVVKTKMPMVFAKVKQSR